MNDTLNVVLLFNLLFGVVVAFSINFIIISNKSQIKNQNENKILSDELNDLGNVAIDEGIYETTEDEVY